MLYLIGGVSRAGKSILADRLLGNHGIAWFSLDVLRMGLFGGAPSLGLDPERDDLEEADRMWPIVRGICANLIESRQNYCLEGACLRPAQAAEIADAFSGQVRACFLGYPGMDLSRKLDLIETYAGGSNDWLSQYDAAARRSFVQTTIAQSAALQAACERLDVSFFDTGKDFEEAILAAERFLVS
jgi:hypothetical protein